MPRNNLPVVVSGLFGHVEDLEGDRIVHGPIDLEGARHHRRKNFGQLPIQIDAHRKLCRRLCCQIDGRGGQLRERNAGRCKREQNRKETVTQSLHREVLLEKGCGDAGNSHMHPERSQLTCQRLSNARATRKSLKYSPLCVPGTKTTPSSE